MILGPECYEIKASPGDQWKAYTSWLSIPTSKECSIYPGQEIRFFTFCQILCSEYHCIQQNPTRTLSQFKSLKIRGKTNLCSSGTSWNGFKSSKIVKGLVGRSYVYTKWLHDQEIFLVLSWWIFIRKKANTIYFLNFHVMLIKIRQTRSERALSITTSDEKINKPRHEELLIAHSFAHLLQFLNDLAINIWLA